MRILRAAKDAARNTVLYIRCNCGVDFVRNLKGKDSFTCACSPAIYGSKRMLVKAYKNKSDRKNVQS